MCEVSTMKPRIRAVPVLEVASHGAALRLLRRWAAARMSGAAALPSLVTLSQQIGVPAEAAIALASVFQLTEECWAGRWTPPAGATQT